MRYFLFFLFQTCVFLSGFAQQYESLCKDIQMLDQSVTKNKISIKDTLDINYQSLLGNVCRTNIHFTNGGERTPVLQAFSINEEENIQMQSRYVVYFSLDTSAQKTSDLFRELEKALEECTAVQKTENEKWASSMNEEQNRFAFFTFEDHWNIQLRWQFLPKLYGYATHCIFIYNAK